MRTPTTPELFDAWEAARASGPLERCEPLLAAVAGDIADLTLGERDRCLFELRERLFGGTMTAVESCPSCRDAMEFTLKTSDLMAIAPAAGFARVELEGYTVICRALTSADLAAANRALSVEEARSMLLEQCVISSEVAGISVPTASLPAGVVLAVAAAVAEADPLSFVELQLSCPGCETPFPAVLNIASYLWQEIDAWADRLFIEVDILARAYSWSEPEILALTPQRRRRYVEMAASA